MGSTHTPHSHLGALVGQSMSWVHEPPGAVTQTPPWHDDPEQHSSLPPAPGKHFTPSATHAKHSLAPLDVVGPQRPELPPQQFATLAHDWPDAKHL